MIACYQCAKPSHELSPRSRCAACEYERSVKNEAFNDEARGFMFQLSGMVTRGYVNLGDEMNYELKRILEL